MNFDQPTPKDWAAEQYEAIRKVGQFHMRITDCLTLGSFDAVERLSERAIEVLDNEVRDHNISYALLSAIVTDRNYAREMRRKDNERSNGALI